MSILGKARRLESKLARTIDGAAEQFTKSGPRGPLQILHAVVGAVDEGLEPAGRGRHVFPFNTMNVSIVAPSRDAQARLAALFDSEPTLHERIMTRLRNAGCNAVHLQISVSFVDQAAPDWTNPDVHVEFDRVATPAAPMHPSPVLETIRLTIVEGAADRSFYTFSCGRINLGRCAEVRDSRNRLVRTNQVAFSDGADGPNSTVSRRHAHIEYVIESRHYRIRDDGSAHGTGIVRDGKTITVPSGPRGIRLQSDDELLLGEARLRVRIENC